MSLHKHEGSMNTGLNMNWYFRNLLTEMLGMRHTATNKQWHRRLIQALITEIRREG